MKLLNQIRVENDPVLSLLKFFASVVRAGSVAMEVPHGVYSAWMRKEVPNGRAVNSREFKRLSAYVDDNPSFLGGLFLVVQWQNTHALKAHRREPLAVGYDLVTGLISSL